jgi:protein-S-isoprenylcysteine O-methyltransferase Ste14
LKTLFSLLRSIIYVPAFILFFGWIALSVRVYDQRIGLMLPLWTRPVGIVLMNIGGILCLICISVFIIRGKGTPSVFDPPTEFVAIGPYKYVRNPMYIGGFISLVGFGLFHHSISILILSAVLMFLFHLFVVFVEEPQLKKRFGESYVEYKNSVKRWVLKWKITE